MTDDALLLIGREANDARSVYETHANRLRDRNVADSVHVATYANEPRRDLEADLGEIGADRTYAVPMCMAHTMETTTGLPATLAGIDGDVQYCEPVGRSPAMTQAILDRAGAHGSVDDSTTLVLVGFGNTSGSYHRQVTEYHATNARAQTEYGGVVSCYLLQNPAVECVRYNVATESAVAVPLFVASSVATDDQIPTALELDRGGIAYADPLGDHHQVTDAVHDRLETQRVLAESRPDPASFEAALAETARPLATDGEGT